MAGDSRGAALASRDDRRVAHQSPRPLRHRHQLDPDLPRRSFMKRLAAPVSLLLALVGAIGSSAAGAATGTSPDGAIQVAARQFASTGKAPVIERSDSV